MIEVLENNWGFIPIIKYYELLLKTMYILNKYLFIYKCVIISASTFFTGLFLILNKTWRYCDAFSVVRIFRIYICMYDMYKKYIK